MEITIHNSIRDVGEVEWDSITGTNSIVCTYRFLLAVEESGINDCRYYYPVVRDDGRIIAHACLYSISTQLDICVTGLLKTVADHVRMLWKRFLVMRTLECGTPVALGSTVSFAEDVNREQILAELSDAVEWLRKSLGIPVVIWRDYYAGELQVYDVLLGKGYRRFRMMPDAQLEVKWKSFEEYLASMRSHYRYKVAKRMRKCRQAGITVRVLADFGDHAAILAQLWRNTYEKAGEYKREKLTPAFFRNIGRYLQGRSMIIQICKDDQSVGFALVLRDGVALASLFVGVDYSCNDKYSTYFNLFYETVRLAVETGAARISFGITCLESKRNMGAEVVCQYAYTRCVCGLLTRMVSWIFDMTMRGSGEAERRVFRSKCCDDHHVVSPVKDGERRRE